MAKNDILFNIKTTVDGKETIVQTTSAVRDLGKEADRLNDFKKTFNSIVDSSKPLKTQLGQLKKLMSEMEFSGMAGTEEFQHIAQYAGQMADAIGDANAQVQYFANDTKVLSSVVSGFQAVASSIQLVQGAMALFGAENKEAAEVLKKVQGAMALANGVQQVANLLNKDSALIQGVVNLQRKLSATLARKNAAAIAAETTATKGATVATKALNAVMKANPIGLVITAITTLIGLFAIFSGKAEEASDEMKKMEVNGHDLSDEMGRMQLAQEETGKKAGELLSKYEELRVKFISCKDEMARTQFLEANKSGFEALGLNIRNTADAMDYFVSRAPEMRRALMLIAVAQGMQEGMKQYVAKWSEQQATNPIQSPSLSDYNQRFKMSRLMNGGYNFVDQWMYDAGITNANVRNYDASTGTGQLDLQGIGKARDYWYTKVAQEQRERQNEFDSVMRQMTDNWLKAEEEAEKASAALGINFANGEIISPKSGGSTKAAKTPSVSTPKIKNVTSKVKQAVQKDVKNIKQLSIPVDGMEFELDGDFVITPDSFRKAMEGSLEDVSTSLAKPLVFDPRKAMSFEEGANFDRMQAIHAGATSGIEDVRGWFDAGLIGQEKAQEFIDTFNEQLKSVGLEPIEVNLRADAMRQQITDVTDTVNILSSSLGTAFGAFNQLMKGNGEDEYGLMVGKIIAQTIATLSLSFAQAMKSASSNWVTWLAFGLTGAAQLTSMIAQIRGLNSGGYASGGIIPGSSTSGDRVLARVNSGEMILNTLQQRRLFGMLNGTVPAAGATPTASLGILRNSLNTGRDVTFTVSGRNLVGVMSNETRISSRSGRKTNIKI